MGRCPSNLVRKANDQRGKSTISTVHYVVISSAGKLPDPTYFDVVSGGIVYNNGGAHFSVPRGPEQDSVPPPDNAYGLVKTDGGASVSDALIYYAVRNANASGSHDVSEMRCELLRSKDGSCWHTNLAALRQRSSSSRFDYNEGDLPSIYIQTDARRNAYQAMLISTSRPASQVNLDNWLITRQATGTPSSVWTTANNPNAEEGSILRGKKTPAGQATQTVTCASYTLFRWYTEKWVKAGITAVTIDGAAMNLDNYAPSPQWQTVWTFFLERGAHTITISSSKYKNSAAKGKFTVLDALEIW